MSKLILNDQSEITIEGGSSLSNMIIVSETKNDMITTWNMLTDENLKYIQVYNDDGVFISDYRNIVLDSETSTIIKYKNDEGKDKEKIMTSFHFRYKTEMELLREEMEALKKEQKIQDTAIMDLVDAVSELSDQEI